MLGLLLGLLLLPFHLEVAQIVDFVRQKVFLRPAALPAIPPVQNEKLETKGIDFYSRLEADAQVVVVHLVELGTRVQQADVTGDRE